MMRWLHVRRSSTVWLPLLIFIKNLSADQTNELLVHPVLHRTLPIFFCFTLLYIGLLHCTILTLIHTYSQRIFSKPHISDPHPLPLNHPGLFHEHVSICRCVEGADA